jgi:putative peptidoglycan lipid II flippase
MSSIILSRITGFVREMLVPNIMGVGWKADAYNIAFIITGLMYDMLVGGAIAAALIPILTGYIEKKDEEEGWKAVGTFINVIFFIMVVVCILGMVFAPQIIPAIAVGYRKGAVSQQSLELTVKLMRILFPSVGFLVLWPESGFALEETMVRLGV